MRRNEPRIAPMAEAELSPEQRAILDGAGFAGRLNILKTLVRYPAMLRAFLTWGNHVMGASPLDPLLRELAILRTGYLCRAGYEWLQHSLIASRLGMSDDAIARIKAGAGAGGWTAEERAVLAATDELVAGHMLSDKAWAALDFLGDEGRTALVFAVGQYVMVSMVLNSLGIQPEEGLRVDPDLRA
ncbi:carboxymuconolactone decarboxylase family protein [Thermaurantiacus sp.]